VRGGIIKRRLNLISVNTNPSSAGIPGIRGTRQTTEFHWIFSCIYLKVDAAGKLRRRNIPLSGSQSRVVGLSS